MRVAFVGNSHLTAFKAAEAEIAARHPGLEIHFFGLPNPVFFRHDALGGAALRVAEPVNENPAQVIDPEGSVALDLGAYDLVLLTSHGFYLRHLWAALGGFNVLGLAPIEPGRASLSQPCLRATIAASTKAYARRLRAFYPALDQMIVVQMPFPSTAAQAMNPALADLAAQPDVAELFTLYQTTVAEATASCELTLYPVPDAVMAAPFFCKADYARATELPVGQMPILSDLGHMNAAYAADLFDHLYTDLIA